jgi:hypothetical protein
MMPYFVPDVRSLEGKPLVGKGDCVELIKELVPGLQGKSTTAWRQGARVLDTTALLPGTAIATFVDGRYPDNESGQHAALFVAYAGKAIWVMDQWKGDKRKPAVSMRMIYPKPPQGGSLSNSSQAFYVIELH